MNLLKNSTVSKKISIKVQKIFIKTLVFLEILSNGSFADAAPADKRMKKKIFEKKFFDFYPYFRYLWNGTTRTNFSSFPRSTNDYQ